MTSNGKMSATRSTERIISATVSWLVRLPFHSPFAGHPPLTRSVHLAVGRWQKNKDLSWYAKGDKSSAAVSAAEARKEEIRRIKEAEESALSEALGYGPTIKRNANETPIGQKEVERAIKETAEGDDEEEGAKGVGFGAFLGAGAPVKEERDVLSGEGLDRPLQKVLVERKAEDDGRREMRRRSRSRDRSRERRHRRHTHGDERSYRRRRSRDRSHHRSRNRSRERHSYRRERSRSYDGKRQDTHSSYRRRERSYSPEVHHRRKYSRDRDRDYRR